MHCETPWHQVRYTFGERESMEILSGEIMGQLKSFTGSRRDVHSLLRIRTDNILSVTGFSVTESQQC